MSSARTRIERAFDPEAVLRMKERSGQDMSVGGPNLAGAALCDRFGDFDDCHSSMTDVYGREWSPSWPTGAFFDIRRLALTATGPAATASKPTEMASHTREPSPWWRPLRASPEPGPTAP
jgi:hypothetical protein